VTPMRKVCLALPTHRECAGTIAAIHAEAAYGASTFGVEVEFLILDSCDPGTYTRTPYAICRKRTASG
jgi:hypothetical protein